MESVESDTFYGDFMVKLVWRLSGIFTGTTWSIKLPEWLVWRLYGDNVESDTFCEDFMVK